METRLVPGFSLQEALDMVFSEENYENEVTDIYFAPPDSNILTDEDSGDEDLGGDVDNLSAKQLLAEAEVRFSNNARVSGFEGDVRSTENEVYEQAEVEVGNETQDNEATIIQVEESERDFTIAEAKSLGTKEKRKKKKAVVNRTWIDGDMIKSSTFPQPDYSEFVNKSPTELFEMFLDDNIMHLLLEESKRYALFCNCPEPNISLEELKCFLGILVLSGYNKLPGKNFYWDSEADVGNMMVKQAMRRDRFRQIMRFLHCADNSKHDKDDKLWKLRPLINKLQENFLKYFKPTEHLNYDESMVKYYGRHGCKQFIRGKPIRFGYKVWCLNAENGYLINFDIYQGSSPKSKSECDERFGKATSPLVLMLDSLPEKRINYQIFVDNLFTSFSVLSSLKERGYGVTSTMRENRIPKDCALLSKSVMSKKPRGYFESKISKNEGIMLVRWMDNAPVTMVSTTYGIQPTGTVKRYSQAQKKVVQVTRPHLVAMYNKYMGGTDRMDEDIAKCRIGIRSKKWYWPLLTWLIDCAIHNSWILYKSSGRHITNLNFRREIVQTYLTKYKNVRKKMGRPSTSRNSPFDFFNAYFTDEIFGSMVEFTNSYAAENDANFDPTTNEEIRTFVGIHILMGHLHYPRIRCYWDQKLRISMIADSMAINRFHKIRQNLHFVNVNSHDPEDTDRLWKVRPLYNAIRKKCLKLPLETNLCIDEQMIPFKGNINIKQYIKNKPVKWGMKMFAICGSSGLLYDFIIYQGAATEIDEIQSSVFGFGGAIAAKLAIQRNNCSDYKL